MQLLQSIKADKFSLVRFLPKRFFLGSSSLFFLAFIFPLLSLGISFLKPCVFTPYLPFLVAIGSFACLRYKVKGLFGCLIFLSLIFLILSPEIEKEMKTWQTLMLFHVFLDFLIVLLTRLETAAFLEEKASELHKTKMTAQRKAEEFHEKEKSLQEKINEFEEAIFNLKEEAKARLVERAQMIKNVELIQSEIEMLNSQKDEFIYDTKVAQTHVKEIKERAKEAILSLQENVLNLQRIKTAFQNKVSSGGKSFEAQYLQLKQQFEEKNKILSQTRKNLFQKETEIEAKKIESYEQILNPEREVEQALEKNLTYSQSQKEELEKEIIFLEELISHILLQ